MVILTWIQNSLQVRIYRELTKETGGDFGVILDDEHLRDLLNVHLEPPPAAAAAEASLIKMGFPCHSGEKAFSFVWNYIGYWNCRKAVA